VFPFLDALHPGTCSGTLRSEQALPDLKLIHRETGVRRARRIAAMLASGDASSLAFALWLRWNRLEFGYAEYSSPIDGTTHAHSGGPILDKVVRSLDVPDDAVALDLGAGMGIAALTLSRHFSSVIGVELSPEFIAAARRNVAKMKVGNIVLHCGDARFFTEGLDSVTHVYMFNPFPEPVMAATMANLAQSIERVPRELTIIYKLPVYHDAVVAAGFVHRRDIVFKHAHPFAIYDSGSRSAAEADSPR
jgi:hypothetical protein